MHRLDRLFTDHDLKSATLQKYPLSKALIKPWSDNTLMVFGEMSNNMASETGSENDRIGILEYQETLEKAFQESYNGVTIGLDFLVAVGQKQDLD